MIACSNIELHFEVVAFESTVAVLVTNYTLAYCARIGFKVVVAYWKVKTPCHAHGECIN